MVNLKSMVPAHAALTLIELPIPTYCIWSYRKQ